jgi:3-hydroxyisobutyrate dehydrogenase
VEMQIAAIWFLSIWKIPYTSKGCTLLLIGTVVRAGFQELAGKTAFIGLGIMGGSMASNLVRAGFSVAGYNRTPGRATAMKAVESGVQVIGSPGQAVQDADVVFLCLSDVPDIEQMLFGADGIALQAKKGAVIVDMSTTGPSCAKQIHAKLQKLGLRFLDAPVTGGDVGAREGTLTIMVGGAESDYQECHERFAAMGKKIFYCGPAGSGQAVKLCNQILCAVNLLAVCESLQLADILQVDPKLVVDICQTGAAGSWSLANLGPRILKSDFSPGFKIKDMLKDLRLVHESVTGAGGRNADECLPATALADECLRTPAAAGDTGGGDRGTQSMICSYQRRASDK